MTVRSGVSRNVFQAVSFTRQLSLILLIGGVLSGQTNSRSGPGTSYLVTVQELQHNVSKAARAEMRKAEKARLQNRTDEAIDHLKKAVQIDPSYVAARNNLAVSLVATDPQSALAHLEEAIKVDPHQSALFNNLAVGYAMMNKLGDAERAARAAADLDRTNVRIQTMLGVVLMAQHKYTAEALGFLERGCQEYPIARLFAAQILISQSKFEQAKPYVESYLSSGDQRYRDRAARWLDVIGQRQQASAPVLPNPF